MESRIFGVYMLSSEWSRLRKSLLDTKSLKICYLFNIYRINFKIVLS